MHWAVGISKVNRHFRIGLNETCDESTDDTLTDGALFDKIVAVNLKGTFNTLRIAAWEKVGLRTIEIVSLD